MSSQVKFRNPYVPTGKTIGGQLISGSTQDRLTPIRGSAASERAEFEFPSQSNFAVGGSSEGQQSFVDRGDIPLLNQLGAGLELGSGDGFGDVSPFFAGGDSPPNQDELPPVIETLKPPLNDEENERTPNGLEVIKQRYPDGKPRIIRHVAQDENGNYFNQGPWEVRNPSGQIVAAGTYVRGQMHGQWRRQHDASSGGLFSTKPFNLFQGPFLSVAQFKYGKLDGLWTIYDRYRQKIFEIPYTEGVRQGTATWFYPNNSKMREATFQNGLIDGEVLDWNDSEKLVKRDRYVEGRRIVRNTTFYRPKVKKSEDYFLASKLQPEDQDNWWDAKPAPFLPTGSEVQNGASMEWYENLQPKKQGQYKEGKPIGQFTWWHANGNKQIEGFYVKGAKSRRWTWWYENGMKQVEGVYDDDQPTGVWRSWFSDGQLRKEEDFSDREPAKRQDANPDSEVSGSDDSAIVLEDITPAVEILPSPVPGDLKLQAPDREEMEGISPLEFREPAVQGSPGENESETKDSGLPGNGIQKSGIQKSGIQKSGIQKSGIQKSGIQESGALPEGFFDGVDNSGKSSGPARS